MKPGSLASKLTLGSFTLGAVGLLGAMAIDTAAVLGRHLRVPVLGSIELVEGCVVLMASAALVGTTLERGHASVHVVTERLSEPARALLGRISDALSALFFLALTLGSAIIFADLWHGDEQSELLGVPYAPLRAVWCASALGVAGWFARRALTRRPTP